MNKNDHGAFYASFAMQWQKETEMFKKLTEKELRKKCGIWKPTSIWREKYEKRKQRDQAAN